MHNLNVFLIVKIDDKEILNSFMKRCVDCVIFFILLYTIQKIIWLPLVCTYFSIRIFNAANCSGTYKCNFGQLCFQIHTIVNLTALSLAGFRPFLHGPCTNASSKKTHINNIMFITLQMILFICKNNMIEDVKRI